MFSPPDETIAAQRKMKAVHVQNDINKATILR